MDDDEVDVIDKRVLRDEVDDELQVEELEVNELADNEITDEIDEVDDEDDEVQVVRDATMTEIQDEFDELDVLIIFQELMFITRLDEGEVQERITHTDDVDDVEVDDVDEVDIEVDDIELETVIDEMLLHTEVDDEGLLASGVTEQGDEQIDDDANE